MTTYDYSNYRKHIEELAYKKQRLNEAIAQKKIAHAKYRKFYQEYRELAVKQDTITKELMDLIPERWN